MADIFLSYAAEDRETARKLAAALETTGWSVWWDRRIPAGMTWRDVIQNALDTMHCMVVLWSRNSIESRWVSEEAEEARTRGKLVPVMIEEVNPPLGFRSIHAADLMEWDGAPNAPGLLQLISDLESLLGKPPGKGSTEASTGGPSKPPDTQEGPLAKAWRRLRETAVQGPARTAVLTLLAGAVVVGGAMLLWPMFPRHEGSVENAKPGTPIQNVAPPAMPAPPQDATPTPPAQVETPVTGVVKPVAPAKPAVRSTTKKNDSRCGEILSRLQLGESLSDEDSAFLRKECR